MSAAPALRPAPQSFDPDSFDPEPAAERPPADAPMRRPKLLMSAARHGLSDYRRERDLPRLLRGRPGDILPVLRALEAEAEDQRRAGDHAWSSTRHVELLIALLAETFLHRA